MCGPIAVELFRDNLVIRQCSENVIHSLICLLGYKIQKADI